MITTVTKNLDDQLASLREDEAAAERIASGAAEPGDNLRIHGTPYATQQQRDRLKGVRHRRDIAGTAKQWREANEHLARTEKSTQALVTGNQRKIDDLQRQLNALTAESSKATSDLTAARNTVDVMERSREMLQSAQLLPPVITQEIILLINNAGLRAAHNALTREMQQREAEGHREDAARVRAKIEAMLARMDSASVVALKKLRQFYVCDLY